MGRNDLARAAGDVLGTGEPSIQIDRCFWLLADRRRRFCLYHLYLVDGPAEIEELAAAIEAAVTPREDEVTEHAIEEAYLTLVHNHLPRLQDEGIVRVREGTVRLEADPDLPVRELLAATATAELDRAGRLAIGAPE